MNVFFNSGISGLDLSVYSPASLGDVVVLAASHKCTQVLSVHMDSATARNIAAELLSAVDAVEQSLSSTPPATSAAESLPADGGDFSSEGAST